MSNILLMSAVLVFLVVILRAMFGKRMSMRLRYALWLPVAIRLLLPIQIGQSAISVANLIKPAQNAQPITAAYDVVTAPMAVQTATPVAAPEQSFSPWQIIWFVGIAVTAIWFLFVNIRFYYRARKGAERMQHPGFRVFVSKGVSSPCQIGHTIFLTPEVAADAQSLQHVLAHEKTHFYHGDTFWSLLRAVLVCVYWFFPPVWLAAALSKQDCELACDEGALRRIGEKERFAYGKTLLSVAAHASATQRLFCTATTMAQSKQELSARIEVIAARKSRPILLTVLLIALMGVSVICTFTGKAAATVRPVEPPAQTYFNDSMLETAPSQERQELPVVNKPSVKERSEVAPAQTQPTEPAVQAEEPTEAPTVTYAQTQPQTEMPYEAQQVEFPHGSPPGVELPDQLSGKNMELPPENIGTPNSALTPTLPSIQTPPDNYGVPVINLDPNNGGPYVEFP